MELDLVVERADHALVDRQQPHQECFGAVLHEIERERHAAAGVEHDDDGDRRGLVVEVGERLQLAVVVDLEVLLRQVRDEPLLRIRDRDVQRHGLRGDLDALRAGRRDQKECRGRDRQPAKRWVHDRRYPCRKHSTEKRVEYRSRLTPAALYRIQRGRRPRVHGFMRFRGSEVGSRFKGSVQGFQVQGSVPVPCSVLRPRFIGLHDRAAAAGEIVGGGQPRHGVSSLERCCSSRARPHGRTDSARRDWRGSRRCSICRIAWMKGGPAATGAAAPGTNGSRRPFGGSRRQTDAGHLGN